MLRSHFEFACVLHFIFISFVSSASFGDFCSNDLSCNDSLICSNSSKCICPLLSSETFWNTKHNTCLYCPHGWIAWQNEKCLLFITPSKGGIIRERARNACLSYSSQLLQIDYHQDFLEFEYKTNKLLNGKHSNALIEFLSNGIWINFTDYSMNSYEWCDIEYYENDIYPWNDCIGLTKQYSIDKNNISLCLNRVQCNEKLSYICEKSANIPHNENDEQFDNRIFGFIGDLVGNIFFPTPKPAPATQPPPTVAPEPPQPLIIYQTNPSKLEVEQPLAQTGKSSNTMLYIGIAAGVVVLILLILLCCCFCGGFLLLKTDNTSKSSARSSRFRRRHERNSIESTASDGTN